MYVECDRALSFEDCLLGAALNLVRHQSELKYFIAESDDDEGRG